MSNSQNMQDISINGASNFKFSAVRPEELGATEYTLVNIVVDSTGSVRGFSKELKAAVQSIIESSRKSPRADNLLVRLTTFNSGITEVFGFKNLSDIDSNAIEDFYPTGLTALYDATYDAIGATERYGQILYDQEFDVNGAVYVVTDGADNDSHKARASDIAKQIEAIYQEERMESIVTMLIGVNTGNSNVSSLLKDFSDKAKFSQYVDVGDATPGKLAKLAGFVSKSISSQSQALGTGTASQSLTF